MTQYDYMEICEKGQWKYYEGMKKIHKNLLRKRRIHHKIQSGMISGFSCSGNFLQKNQKPSNKSRPAPYQSMSIQGQGRKNK